MPTKPGRAPLSPLTQILTLRVPDDLKEQLEILAKAVKRSKSFLVLEALRSYIEAIHYCVDTEAWQIKNIRSALRQAELGNFAEDGNVKLLFSKWHAHEY